MYVNPLKTVLGESFFKDLPSTPGVYFMRDLAGRLLYIGKAKSLRTRLRSYSRLHPKRDDERLVDLVSHIRTIHWENHATEAKALTREAVLLKALRPPYNVAGTDEELYLYLGIRDAEMNQGSWLGFRLSNWPDFAHDGYQVFGAYRNRRLVKQGYSALLRLIYAYQFNGQRFSYPAKISRESPAWVYRAKFPAELVAPLKDFLSGRSRRLLTLVFDGMLENESIPVFMRPSIQDDIDVVKALFRTGPGVTRKLMRRHGFRAQPMQPEEMSALVAKDILISLDTAL